MNKPAAEDYKVVGNCGLVIPDEERRQSFLDLMDQADVWIFWSTFGHRVMVSDRQ
jgi:hypothetical protein